MEQQSGSVQQSENETDNGTMGRDLVNTQSLSNDVHIDEKESDLQDLYNTEKVDDIGQSEDSNQSQGSSDRGSLKSGNTTNSHSSGEPTSMPPGVSNKDTAVDNNPELTLSQVAAHLAVYEVPTPDVYMSPAHKNEVLRMLPNMSFGYPVHSGVS